VAALDFSIDAVKRKSEVDPVQDTTTYRGKRGTAPPPSTSALDGGVCTASLAATLLPREVPPEPN
jgi:hypothetical protein